MVYNYLLQLIFIYAQLVCHYL